MKIIEAIELTKIYGEGASRVEALRGVSLDIVSGEMAAIMGPSGSGKSTLLHLLGAVDSPTSGSLRFEGREVGALSEMDRTLLRRRKIGFVFQSFNLLPTLTAEENVAIPLELDGAKSAEALKKAREKLEIVRISHRGDHLPSMLSGGEQQRVAIARALVIEPALLLADEPTGNLDTKTGDHIKDILRKLVDEHGETVVLVTHDGAVAEIADRLIELRDGKIEKITSAPSSERGEQHAAVS